MTNANETNQTLRGTCSECGEKFDDCEVHVMSLTNFAVFCNTCRPVTLKSCTSQRVII